MKFSLRTVKESQVLKILKSLKSKKSFGADGISSEVLKIGADILVVPLTYIINYSIKTGKFPTEWKLAKVIPLHKKGDKRSLNNYTANNFPANFASFHCVRNPTAFSMQFLQ